jgi:hypothetical protein
MTGGRLLAILRPLKKPVGCVLASLRVSTYRKEYASDPSLAAALLVSLFQQPIGTSRAIHAFSPSSDRLLSPHFSALRTQHSALFGLVLPDLGHDDVDEDRHEDIAHQDGRCEFHVRLLLARLRELRISCRTLLCAPLSARHVPTRSPRSSYVYSIDLFVKRCIPGEERAFQQSDVIH